MNCEAVVRVAADVGLARAGDDPGMVFCDRRDAGCRLAERLGAIKCERPVVVALPPGGVPVGFEIAQRLGAPLDIPAVSRPGGAEDAGMTVRDRDGRQPVDVRNRTVILVDDGVDNRLGELAAVRALRARGAARVVVAVPAGTDEWVATLGRDADEVVCLARTRALLDAPALYENASPVPDAELEALLEVAASGRTPAPGQMPVPEHFTPMEQPGARDLRLEVDGVGLAAELIIPAAQSGVVVFVDGDGVSRRSLRTRTLAAPLHRVGLATLLIDLLSERERKRQRSPARDVELLAHRLEGATRWAIAEPQIGELPIGYLGASTGAGAALAATVAVGDAVRAVVTMDGRPDLAAGDLARVTAATLLLAGGRDPQAIERAHQASNRLQGPRQLTVVEGAGRLFAEPGTLQTAARLAAEWFAEHLSVTAPVPSSALGRGRDPSAT